MRPLLPTAQPSVAETMSMPFRVVAVGDDVVDQLVPFQWMIVPPSPTANPFVSETMETANRSSFVGESSVDQLGSSHWRIAPSLPTAKPYVSFTQETAFRSSAVSASSSATHDSPSHINTVPLSPTATPSIVETMSIPFRFCTVGESNCVQLALSQRKSTPFSPATNASIGNKISTAFKRLATAGVFASSTQNVDVAITSSPAMSTGSLATSKTAVPSPVPWEKSTTEVSSKFKPPPGVQCVPPEPSLIAAGTPVPLTLV